MFITLSLGWWMIPAAVTALSFGAAAYVCRDMGDDRFGVAAVISAGFYLAATVLSLLAWLIWALAN